MTKRGWQACAISIAGHGLIVFGIVQLCAFLRHNSQPAEPVVNRVIAPPVDYAHISISFDEQSIEPKTTAFPPKVNPRKHKEELPARSPGTAVEPQPMPGTQSSGVVQAEHRGPGIAPLHGKIARPGASIVYVLDQSGSMARKLQRAVAMLKASLHQLDPAVRFQIVAYDSHASITRIGGSLELVSANADNVAAVEKLLDELVGEGSSRHTEGLRIGLGLHPDTLILLTDADELTPPEVNRLREWNRKGTTIHAVVFGKPAGDGSSSLRDLAGIGHVHFLEAKQRK